MIVVIGGGAAGMMAAIRAAQCGAEVTLLERNRDLGKKLRITGKGRCNVTNACETEDIFENIPRNHRFLYSAIYSFTNYDVMSFFEDCGVPLKEERGQRIFPKSDKAADIVNALRKKLSEQNVRVVQGRAREILIENGHVKGVRTETTTLFCDSVILATGGKSYPVTGSDGDGYTIAENLGHKIIPVRGSLVPLETEESTQKLMGLSLKNISVTVFDEKGRKLFTDFGEMLFTHYGVTGPVILSASSHMGENPYGKKVEIDLKPALDEQMLDKRILRDFEKYHNKNYENSLSELLPNKMIDYIVEVSGIDPYKKVNSITKEERKALVNALKHLTFTAWKYRPISEAIITSGGVDVKEINSSTMESTLIGGLFFAGEVIDTDAYTGGFNLQIAFSTGYLAGEKAAKKEMESK